MDVLRLRVPAPETEIEPADAGFVIVDYDDLLVMTPEKDILSDIQAEMFGMSLNVNKDFSANGSR